MMTTIETYVRTGRSKLHQWALNPDAQRGAILAGCFLWGLVLSGASLAHTSLPLPMGLVCALNGWQAVLAAAGGAVGYLLFWGRAAEQGLVWLVCALAVVLGLGKRRITEESPLLMSAIAGLIVSASGLAFQIWRQDTTSVTQYLLRIALGALSAKLFEVVRQRRDAGADWLAVGFGVLALSQIAPWGFSFGYIAAGTVAVWGSLPVVALAGLALDLAQITRTSMTAALCLAYLARNAHPARGWIRYAAPGAVYLAVMHLSGNRDWLPFFALTLGAGLGTLLPEPAAPVRRRGETGMVQTRLELMAACLSQTRQLLLEEPELPVDEEALLMRTRERACGGCPNRKNCRDRDSPLPVQLLHSPLVETASLSVPCKKPGRLILELRRSQEQLRALRGDRERQREYRTAVLQQYAFLEEFLQQEAAVLPRRAQWLRPRYTPEVAIRSAGREIANGDRCASFPGPGCRHYVLLCDGMGTGMGAAQEAQTATELLRRMLTAGFPARHALRSVNSLLVLRGRAAAVTMDLAELRLDSGRATVYKWGAAPSYLLRDGMAEKIGTATPPPGLSVSEGRETVERLSLSRGELLILVSDGAQIGETLGRSGEVRTLPPGEVAVRLLEAGARDAEDDATVAVVRLEPGAVATS